MSRSLVFTLFISLFSCNSSGQVYDSFFSQKTDSLDRIEYIDSSIKQFTRFPYAIKVRNQDQFNHINKSLKEAIEAGETNIIIKIDKGVYHFAENHIVIEKGQYSDVSIKIEGNHAVLTSDVYYNGGDSYMNTPWTELKYADGVIEVINPDTKLCKIPCINDYSADQKSNLTKLQITKWYQAPTFNIEKIDTSGIYFLADEIKYVEAFGRKGYTINYDFMYNGLPPRFRLYDKTLERNHIASTFLRLGFSALRYVEITGIEFKGNKKKASIIELNNIQAKKIVIKKCSFDALEGNALSAVNTDNVLLEKCVIKNTSGNEVSFTNGCHNVCVKNNIFENCGIALSNSLCIRCNESEYYIADNVFRDFGYCAIAVGLWHGHTKTKGTKGIIERNEIYFTPEYAANKEKHTLMDGGAVYVWTQNDVAIIRYNYIHDYVGMRSYSGVYCDDGASNCKIYGNIILNTPNGCSILSHKVTDQKASWKNNMYNFIANNIVDGSIIFEGYGLEERHCVKGVNLRLNNEIRQQYSNRLNGLEFALDDIEVLDWSRENGRLRLPVKYERIAKKMGIKRYR